MARVGTMALLLVVGCAGASAGPASTRLEPPKMMSGSRAPELRIPPANTGRSPIRVAIEVLIDDEGRPDMSTFKATGAGAAENRAALERWIEQAVFRPAQLRGEPTPAIFRTSVEFRLRRVVR
jgi:hypothetical protein